MKAKLNSLTIGTLTLFAAAAAALADDSAATTADTDTRYGLFNGLDHRSNYGQGAYPEPFLIDDSDLEQREFRLDWLHTGIHGNYSDTIHPELEWGIGNMTLELEVPYERNVEDGVVTKGFANVDVGARYPFFQFVSRSNLFDTTFGAAVELGIPTTSAVSHNTEFVPKVFNDTKIGKFSAQTVLGYSMLYGPGEEGGVNTFEYGFVFGYDTLEGKLPGVEKVIPVAELSGETQLNKGASGQTILTGDLGLRFDLKTIGGIQPRPGVVFVYPLNNNSRQEQHWGVMTSLVFEF
jgi:hypothetical protein